MSIKHMVEQRLFYSPDTGHFTWKSSGKRAGTTNQKGYRYIQIDGKLYRENRLAFLVMTGAIPELVDHKNGNTEDNRWDNLREASLSQNQYNSRVPKNNTSGVKGVSWRKDRNKYQVRVSVAKGKYKTFGCFDSLELAELVANEAREKYHGEFARHK
jgi:hypothetical protein